MTSREAADFIREQVRVARADIAAAKEFILKRLDATAPFQRRLSLKELADDRVRDCGDTVPAFIELDDGPAPVLAAAARNVSLRTAVFVAASELTRSGLGVLTPRSMTV